MDARPKIKNIGTEEKIEKIYKYQFEVEDEIADFAKVKITGIIESKKKLEFESEDYEQIFMLL